MRRERERVRVVLWSAARPVNFRDRQLGRPAEVFELRAVELMRRSYQTFPVHNSQHADARDAAYVRTA